MKDENAEKILAILRNTFSIPKWIFSSEDPFKTLVATIISQNTNDLNTAKAFENLSNNFRITPEILAKAEVKDIERCLKVAGLYRNKSRVIKQVSEEVVQKYKGDLKRILVLPLEEARSLLLDFRGVGPKTADVLLLFAAKKSTIPVDTHVNRVSKRLGLAPQDGDYEDVRQALQALFDSKDYLSVHLLLIACGRKYCKAHKPLCSECPLRNLCRF